MNNELTGDAAIVGRAADELDVPQLTPIPDESEPDFSEGEWLHVKIGPAGDVESVIRPPSRSWHDAVDLMLAGVLVVRAVEHQVIGEVYTSLGQLVEEKQAVAAKMQTMRPPPTLRELLGRRR